MIFSSVFWMGWLPRNMTFLRGPAHIRSYCCRSWGETVSIRKFWIKVWLEMWKYCGWDLGVLDRTAFGALLLGNPVIWHFNTVLKTYIIAHGYGMTISPVQLSVLAFMWIMKNSCNTTACPPGLIISLQKNGTSSISSGSISGPLAQDL